MQKFNIHIAKADATHNNMVGVSFDGLYEERDQVVFAAICGLARDYIQRGGDTMQGTLQAIEEDLEIDLDPEVVTVDRERLTGDLAIDLDDERRADAEEMKDFDAVCRMLTLYRFRYRMERDDLLTALEAADF